jgi:Secretion system C-terminal sorting domain
MHNAIYTRLCFLFIAFTSLTIEAQTTRFVKPTSSGTTDGSSWLNGSADLQAMINASAAGDAIWVAAGTYKPTKDPFGSTSPTEPRDKTFYLKDGVKIYGGFVGTEGSLSQRNWATNATILSGDFNGNDVVSGTGSTLLITNNSENAFHVVLSVSDANTTELNGFSIIGGNATGGGLTVESKYIDGFRGGGMNSAFSNVTITNTLFTGNSCYFAGAGLYADNGTSTLMNTVFYNNLASGDGGGVGRGGGIYCGASTLTILNSIFYGNLSALVGGGIESLGSTLTLKNSIFTKNKSGNGGGLYNNVTNLSYSNAILWNNSSGTTTNSLYNNMNNIPGIGGSATTEVVAYTIVGGGYAGVDNLNTDPIFRDANNPKGADGLWFTADDGLQVSGCSPAIDAGTSFTAPTTDILGTARPQFAAYDIGAYESTIKYTLTASISSATDACGNAVLTANLTPAPASGTSVTYAWSGGTTPTLATNTFMSNGTHTVTVTNVGCTATATQMVTVVPVLVTPSVSIAASPSNFIVAGTNVTFTATPTNGGPTPQYQWYLNNNPVGTNSATYSNSTLANNNTVKCTMTANNTCQTTNSANSNNITITITATPCPNSTVFYVKQTSSGTGDGSSWANATNNLQGAISNNCGITEIWVAAGTYKPTQDPFGNTTPPTDPRDKTFFFKNNVKLYGGFAGTETQLAQRNWVTNPTILSGDFNGDDIVSGLGTALTIANNSENAIHVVLSVSNDNTALLDGFSVIGGNAANTSGTLTVATKVIDRTNGGGMYNSYSSISIKNCIFEGNNADNGGGIFNNYSSCAISNSVFNNNITITGGSGVYYAYFGFEFSYGSVTNAIFNNNKSNSGAAIACYEHSPKIINSVFTKNVSLLSYGGALYCTSHSTPTVTNCIFWGNLSGSPMITYDYARVGFTSNNFIIQNTILESYPTYNSSSGSGSNRSGENPQFVDINNPKGADGKWFTADDGCRLQNTSPAMDAGMNSGAPLLDILGNPIYNLIKDMGAYEQMEGAAVYQSSMPCQSVTNSVFFDQWYYFRHNNGIIAAINSNGVDLGTVTATISDPTGPIAFNGNKFLGRTVKFTSSNYADGVVMPMPYTLRLYYYDTEISEYNAATGGTFAPSDFNMLWQQGGSTCDLVNSVTTGLVSKTSVSSGEYGPTNNGFYLQFNLDHFTTFAPTTSSLTVVPLELLNFTGHTEGGANLLSWTTASEKNTQFFDIEYSNSGKDFQKIGTIKAAGQSTTPLNYSFNHQKLGLTTQHYYRLKMVDTDGLFQYSKIISLENQQSNTVWVYPNPAKNQVTIQTLDYNQPARLYNLSGVLMYSNPSTPKEMDMANLPTGMYFLHIGTQVLKVVKQ